MAMALEQQVGKLLDETARVATQAVDALAASAIHNAEVCGCAGCKANATEAVRWKTELLSAEKVS